jgi:hypothetical protein
MPYDPKLNVVHSANGRLARTGSTATTTRDDIRVIIAAALAPTKPELVIHFHGGLVDQAAGYGIAQHLWPSYTNANRYGLFFVWEAGLFESIKNNLTDIGNDKLFRQLVKKAARWVLTQLPVGTGLKGSGGAVTPQTLESEFDDYFAGRRPSLPSALQATGGGPPTLKSANEPKDEPLLAMDIEAELQADFQFWNELEYIDKDITSTKMRAPDPKSSGVGETVTDRSEIDPTQVREIFDVTPGGKGVFTLVKVALFLAKVVRAVIRRFRAGHAHGVYTTIVEEILAAAYIDKIGGVVWNQMKKDTGDSFGNSPDCAGAAVLTEIHAQQAAANKKFERIVLIGHSTGAVYIANWLDASAQLLPDAKFDVVLLAPAVTYRRLAETVRQHRDRIKNIRRFGMHDEVESGDVMVPIVYPRSLLYFVSGLLEFSEQDPPERVADTPLVGMERFSANVGNYAGEAADIALVEDLLRTPKGSVWSLTDPTSIKGMRSQSRKHGDFDDDDETVDSLHQITDIGF